MITTERREEGITLLAGMAMPLAFAPFNFFPVSLLALTWLFVSWCNTRPRRAAWLGFIFGLGYFGVGVSWVYVSMHTFGNMTVPLAAFATLLFVSALSCYPAVVGWVQARIKSDGNTIHLILVIPATWVLFEWLRSWLFTGFPWLNIGTSQILTPLAGLAPWTGVYGISLATAVTAGLLAAWWQTGVRTGWRFGLAGAVMWITGALLGNVSWVEDAGKPLQVALIQGNIPLAIKWNPEHRGRIFELYRSLSEKHGDADLAVWPEGALPAYLDQLDKAYVDKLRTTARKTRTDYLFGVVDRKQKSTETVYYNTVASIGSTDGRYYKRHLVPFGEYPPLSPLFEWLMKSFRIPMSNFTPGSADQGLMQLAGQVLGVSICYETAFGAEIIDALPEATVLVNVSENAWYGDSLGPHQLVQMTRMRAIETGRPVLRVDNAGPTVAIDHRGRIIAQAPQFTQAVVRTRVQPKRGLTPYARYGNAPIVLLVISGLLVLIILRRIRGP